MKNDPSTPLLFRLVKFAWNFLYGLSRAVQILLFIMLVATLSAIAGVLKDEIGHTGPKESEIAQGAALLFDPMGELVDNTRAKSAAELFFADENKLKLPTQRLVQAINEAREDERIAGMVIDTDLLLIGRFEIDKALRIANAVRAFRESGKKVIAHATYFSQSQYIVAVEAEEIWLDTDGVVDLTGLKMDNLYYKTLLDKLDITTHTYRHGRYKSAVEPAIRDDMSEDATEANLAFMQDQWKRISARIEQGRSMAQGAVDSYLGQLVDLLEASRGSFAETALQAGFIDHIYSHQQGEQRLIELFGEREEKTPDESDYEENRIRPGYNHVMLADFLDEMEKSTPYVFESENESADKKIMLVHVTGPILSAPLDYSSFDYAIGESVAADLRQARKDDDVVAVVLRIDSPGGSATASRLISDEVVALKSAGKPVVASFGTLAASGGYWVAARASKIVSNPTTLTGSIGIFAQFFTYADLLDRIGVHQDGVSTHEKILDVTFFEKIGDRTDRAIGMLLKRGYDDFLDLVSQGRGLSVETVDGIAQGRIWSGENALEVGLVDSLGTIEDALRDAAALAGVESFDVVNPMRPMSDLEKFLSRFDIARSLLPSPSPEQMILRGAGKPGAVFSRALRDLQSALAIYDDPRDLYYLCMECPGPRLD